MIAVLQLGGVVLLIVALLAFLEARLGPSKAGRELMRFTGNVAGEKGWRDRYDRLPLDLRVRSWCGPARDAQDPVAIARWVDDGGSP